MTELKTLKDLNVIKADGVDDCVYVADLRAEAIKWIKTAAAEKKVFFHVWIQHFFNITDQDLI